MGWFRLLVCVLCYIIADQLDARPHKYIFKFLMAKFGDKGMKPFPIAFIATQVDF